MRNVLQAVLLPLALAIAFSALMLEFRQDMKQGGKPDILALLKLEASSFLGSVLWQKMDFYGHYGHWIEERDGDQIHYVSMFKAQREFVPLVKSSVALDPSSVSRVTLLANTLGASLERFEEARVVLQQSAIRYPQEMRLWRIYGEMGLLYSQVQNDCETALRYFDRAMFLSRRHPLAEYNREDLMNRRFYGYYAANCWIQAKNPDKAFPYAMWSFFEKGNAEYEEVLRPFREALPPEMVPVLPKIAPEIGSEEHHHHHHDDPNHVHDIQCLEDEKLRAAQVQDKLTESYERTRERYMSLIPELRSELMFPISWFAAGCFLAGAVILSILSVVFAKKL